MGEKSWRRKEIRRVLFLLRRVRDRWLWNVRRGESRGSIYRLIFINYINSPRRGQPVDWVTRIIRSSPVSLSLLSQDPRIVPSFFFLFHFCITWKIPRTRTKGRRERWKVFMGSLKTWNTGCQRYRDH